MLAKRFFYVCAGLLCLALAYHFGAVNATAQAPGNPIVAAYATPSSANVVILSNGDVYVAGSLGPTIPWDYRGNVFGSGTPVQQSTWGAMKSRYRGERAPAQPTQDR